MRIAIILIINAIVAMLVAIVIAMASIGTAHAAESVVWQDFGGTWKVFGYPDKRMCLAMGYYTNGRTTSILFDDHGATFAITGINVTEDATYNVPMRASNGSRGVLKGIATASDTIMFEGLNEASVRALLESRSIYIDGLGTFELRGSRAAMASAWDCYRTVSSY
jgi:hypothetical protein